MSANDSFRFTAIGTDWQIDTEHPLPEELRQRICFLAEDFDHVWSRFRADSLITRVAHAGGGGRFDFPARDVALLDLYDRLVAATDGAVDPLIGRDLELLGYDARYTLAPDDAAIAGRCRRDCWARDIRREGLEHPRLPGRVIGTVLLQDAAVRVGDEPADLGRGTAPRPRWPDPAPGGGGGSDLVYRRRRRHRRRACHRTVRQRPRATGLIRVRVGTDAGRRHSPMVERLRRGALPLTFHPSHRLGRADGRCLAQTVSYTGATS